MTEEGASRRGPLGEVLASVANGSPDRTPEIEAGLEEVVVSVSELADRLEDATDLAACKAEPAELLFANDDPRVADASADVLAKYASTFSKLAE